MKQVFFWCTIYLPFYVLSQNIKDSNTFDSRYFEDQFYSGVTYNFILNRPNEVNQRNFSYGIQAGIIKDIPINFDRTVAVGVGLGLGLNTYYTNIVASQTLAANSIEYTINDTDFKRSKLETHSIELPIEMRFRNSTPDQYKFWRLYTGLKLGYVFNARSKYVSNILKRSFNNTNIEKFQYGVTLNVGYNTFNIHLYYALTNLFSQKAILNGENINIKPLQIGLIFYVL